MMACPVVPLPAKLSNTGVGEGNWAWRYKEDALTHELEARLYETCKMFGR